MATILVAGPPCGGKSTWAHEQAGPADLVVDFDDIRSSLGTNRHALDAELQGETRQRWLEQLHAPVIGTRYVVWTAPRRQDRGRFRSMNRAQVVVVMATEAECLARAAAERPPEWQAYVRRWFSRWSPSRSGREVIVWTGQAPPP